MLVLAFVAMFAGPLGSAAAADVPGLYACEPGAPAIIEGGLVRLGICPLGNLNAPGGTPSSGTQTNSVGLRYVPTNADAVSPGCPCEGWGAADATTRNTGFVHGSTGATGLLPVSFTATPTSATSVVEVGTTLRVTQSYQPSSLTPYLYEDTITLENISNASVAPRYRRVLDWDAEPTARQEYVTIQTGNSSAVRFTSDDGGASANPLTLQSQLFFSGNATDSGPADHGALFDLGFPTLSPGEARTFKMYLGAAGNAADAQTALRTVGAEAYSLAKPSTAGNPASGAPNTFMLAFTGVGGDPIVFPPGGDPTPTTPAATTPPATTPDPTTPAATTPDPTTPAATTPAATTPAATTPEPTTPAATTPAATTPAATTPAATTPEPTTPAATTPAATTPAATTPTPTTPAATTPAPTTPAATTPTPTTPAATTPTPTTPAAPAPAITTPATVTPPIETPPAAAPAAAPATQAPAVGLIAPSVGAAIDNGMTAGLSNEVVAGLLRQIKPTGTRARIGRLVSTRSYPVKLKVPSAGRATITWYLLRADGKQTLAGRARFVYGKGSTKIVSLKLSTAAISALRRSVRLKLFGEARFTPAAGREVRASRTFTVRR